MADDLTPDVEVAVAGLDQQAHDHVLEAIHDGADADQAIHDAQAAEAHMHEAEAQQHEQVKAVEEHDYARAHDLAQEQEYHLQEANALGWDADHKVVEAQHDEMATDWAAHHQEIAHDDAAAADSYAVAGDHDHAAMYGDHAYDHASTASDYGHTADHGGSYASHDTSSTSSVDTTTE